MKRWHEQVGGRPGLAHRKVHVEHPMWRDTMLCGRDAFEASMQQIDRAPVDCPNCAAVIIMCKAIPSVGIAVAVRPRFHTKVRPRRAA